MKADELMRGADMIKQSMRHLVTAQNRFDNLDAICGRLHALGEYEKV
jgi:hypothetical protein